MSADVPYIELIPSLVSLVSAGACECSPLKVDGLDDEAQGRAYRRHILVHDALHNGCFASVVESTALSAQPLPQIAVKLTA